MTRRFPVSLVLAGLLFAQAARAADSDPIDSGDIQARQFVSLGSLSPSRYPYRVEMRTDRRLRGEAGPDARGHARRRVNGRGA